MTEKSTEPTEDFVEWGDAWVYCNQHLAVHKTGWCTVGIADKVCVCAGHHTVEEATKKANAFGFKLYRGNANE